MSDPTRPKAPGKFATFLTKAAGAVVVFNGITHMALGAITYSNPNSYYARYNRLVRPGSPDTGPGAIGQVIGGMILAIVGKKLWDVGQFASLTRKAEHRDELLLQRASIDKELEKTR